jgi:hypothetical protein
MLAWNTKIFQDMTESEFRRGLKWPHDRAKKVYTGQATRLVHVSTISDLCLFFKLDPPGVFRWEEQPNRPARLVWQVADLARQKFGGPNMSEKDIKNRASQACRIYVASRFDPTQAIPNSKPQPFDNMYMGWARMIGLDSLGRLLTGLEQEPGPLFVWQ